MQRESWEEARSLAALNANVTAVMEWRRTGVPPEDWDNPISRLVSRARPPPPDTIRTSILAAQTPQDRHNRLLAELEEAKKPPGHSDVEAQVIRNKIEM